MQESRRPSLEYASATLLHTEDDGHASPDRRGVGAENADDTFAGRYDVLDELGKGAYGVVRKVRERESGELYAAKFVGCAVSKAKARAEQEIEIMNRLRHPKLLRLEAAFASPKEVIMVTELISGGELYERVVAKDFTLTERDGVLFTRQICEGVRYMHGHDIVHLDLKPENIMCRSRTSHRIKIIDFGLAREIRPEKPVCVLCGTAEFISPEIVGYEPVGPQSDMWSIGVICYVLLSGKSPFRGANKTETYTRISTAQFDFDHKAFDILSKDAKDFISALLIKKKEDRLTADECLKHKWLTQHGVDTNDTVLSTEELKQFVIRRKWHITGNVIRALSRMNTLSAARRTEVGSGDHSGSVFWKFKMDRLTEEELIS